MYIKQNHIIYSYYNNFIGNQEFRSLKYLSSIQKNMKICEYKLNFKLI